MSGNKIGKLFTLTTAGESHGPAMVGIVDGCPANVMLSVDEIQKELDRRRPGQSKITSQRQEADQIEILSGVYEGKTLGTPIALLIRNTDAKARDYAPLMDCFRPGHADYTYFKKYGHRDPRGGGRSSARETVLRVAAGAIAKKILKTQEKITLQGYLSQMGPLELSPKDLTSINHNEFFCPDPEKLGDLQALIKQCRSNKDSVGGCVTIVTSLLPVGLGEPVYDKLDALLAQAFMSINAVKGVAIGSGFEAARQMGSELVDGMTPTGFTSNHAGGVLGGISSGQPLVARVAFKPTASIPQAIPSITTSGEACEVISKGRHDPCVAIRAVPIVEAMTAIVLLDLYLQHRAYSSISSLK